MSGAASELARRLSANAETACREYLSNGRRQGRYWVVGDVRNAPGRSLYLRLTDATSGNGTAGKWTDAATGEHGDLLDVIRTRCGFADLGEAMAEARRFLRLPQPETRSFDRPAARAPRGSSESARRLFAMSRPIAGTIAEAYLRARGIANLSGVASLRFHPRCYCRSDAHSPIQTRPAMIGAVTDLDGAITGVLRTWLDCSGRDKAPIETPRRAIGRLLGNAVRFEPPHRPHDRAGHDVMVAGEGVETVLSLRCAAPTLPLAAALSAAHLAALILRPTVRRLYVARDNDAAGYCATMGLIERAKSAGVEAIALSPTLKDFNDDLRALGLGALRAALALQMAPEDVSRFLDSPREAARGM